MTTSDLLILIAGTYLSWRTVKAYILKNFPRYLKPYGIVIAV
jgi:hypothetical protein